MPTGRVRQRRRVVDAIPHHRHLTVLTHQLADGVQLVLGQQIGAVHGDAGLLGDPGGHARIVAGQHHRLGHAQTTQFGQRLSHAGAQRVCQRQQSGHASVDGHRRHRLAHAFQRLGPVAQIGRDAHLVFVQQLQAADEHAAAVHARAQAAPGERLDLCDGQERPIGHGDLRRPHHRLRQRMPGSALGRGGQRQHLCRLRWRPAPRPLLRHPQGLCSRPSAGHSLIRRHHIRHFRPAARDRAGLVERDRFQPAQVLEVYAAFDQHATASSSRMGRRTRRPAP